MNYLSLALAALGGTIANFAVGFLVMFLAPALFEEAAKFPAVFRQKEEMMSVMPFAMVATLVTALVVATLYALMQHSGSRISQGAFVGALVGVIVVCGVLHNYVNYNIGLKLAVGQAAAYFTQWVVVGVVVALIYRPVAA